MRGGKLVSKLKSFKHDAKGSIALSMGLLCIPVLLGIGAAIDLMRMTTARAELQTALDNATLAAAINPTLTNKEREKIAIEMLNVNLKSSQIDTTTLDPKFKFVNDTLQISVSTKIPATIMSLAGIKDLGVAANTRTNIAGNVNAEIALVLDFSWSMTEPVAGKTKYIAMQNAATDLINDMVKIDKDKVKFALVPFSHHVRTTLPSTMVRGATGTSWTGCTQDRPYPANTSSATPGTSNDTKWNATDTGTFPGYGCAGYTRNNLTIVPLSNDFDTLKSRLARMLPYAATHVALGVEFGYHTLSPNMPFAAENYEREDNKKFMVVLTDGDQTEKAYGPHGTRSKEQGGLNLLTLCENAKADGITIVTIAFDLGDTPTRRNLNTCASGAENAFIADDTTELNAAFDNIKSLIISQVYLSN